MVIFSYAAPFEKTELVHVTGRLQQLFGQAARFLLGHTPPPV
jgi:hypothetical protein